MSRWIWARGAADVQPEDVIRFEHEGRSFALYRAPGGAFYATDGLCTHEQVHLADGLVIDHVTECPMHNGRYDYCTGEAKGAPVRVALRTYPVRSEAGAVFIDIG